MYIAMHRLCCYPTRKAAFTLSRRMHSFVTACLAPHPSAHWTSGPGVQRADMFKAHPFLALHVPSVDLGIDTSATNWRSYLFIVSSQKPEGINSDSYFAIGPATVGKTRTLTVSPSFPPDVPQLYIHTSPILQDRPPLQANDGRHAHSVAPYRLDEDSYSVFCQAIAAELINRVKRRDAGLGYKPTGGDDVADPSWQSWSGDPRRESFNKPPWYTFEHLEFKDLPVFDSCHTYEELLIFNQLTEDYSWAGVSHAIHWVKSVRQRIQKIELLDPLAINSNSQDLCGITVYDQTLEHARKLHSMTIPCDGDAFTPKTEQSDWDEDQQPLYDHIREDKYVIPRSDTKVIAFDLYGSILDREAALKDALSHIKASDVTVPHDLDMYIMWETLRSRENPSLSYVDLSRYTLRQFAQHAGISVRDEVLEDALTILLKPRIHDDVFQTLTALQARHFKVVVLTCIDASTFERFISPSLPMDMLTVISSDSSAPLYTQTPSLISTLIQHCESAHQGIKPDELLLVTTGQYRILEPAYAAGIPTAIIERPSSRESEVNVGTTAPTYIIGNLPGLCKALDIDIDLTIREANLAAPICNPALPGYRILGIYQATFPLGTAGFGSVWSGVHLLTGASVAIKDEMPQQGEDICVLPYEAQVYQVLEGHQGFPRVHWTGMYGGAHIIVMDQLGANLEQLRRFCRGKLSLKTVLMLAEQLLSRVEYVHSKGLILRDMKPENCAMGMDRTCNVVHVFDFGMAKQYVNPETGKHIAMREDRIPLGPGTPKYSSPNVQFRRDQSRRDDIAALGYSLLYLLHGRLPWQGIYAPTVEAKVQRIGEMKTGKAIRGLLAQSPPEFTTYFDHFFGLGFEDKPDYKLLKDVFRKRMKEEGWEYDWQFDWYDGGFCEGGTLIPEEYITDIKFVTKKYLQ